MIDGHSKALLESVVSLPTMSFHETAISTFIRWYSIHLGLGVKEDAAGNILVTYRGGGRGGVTFAAHMDHPGFEVIAANGRRGKAAFWGKVDPKVIAGSKVRVQTRRGPTGAKLSGRALGKKHLGRHTFGITAKAPIAKGDFGAFDLTPFRIAGDRLSAIACDNLVGVAATLDLLGRLAADGAKVNVAGLFTRAEEAGFLGAFAAMDSGLIPKRDPLVVLECSSAVGGKVVIGDGPVIRAGDLASTYDPEVEVWLSDVAGSLASERGFKYQRALLQGGRCEACVYVARGYRVGAIAMPLGNYHNQGARGPAAERVSVSDYANLIRLLRACAREPMGKDRMKKRVEPIQKHYRGLKKKLMGSA